MERIIGIEERNFSHEDRFGEAWDYDGFVIWTDRQKILLGISSGIECCEQTGYFLTEDAASEFVGAMVLGVQTTDTSMKTTDWEIPDLDGGDIMFVTILTDRGPLQFAAYNSHNGYYGHEALVISEQLERGATL